MRSVWMQTIDAAFIYIRCRDAVSDRGRPEVADAKEQDDLPARSSG
jgi:hypothetical protein